MENINKAVLAHLKAIKMIVDGADIGELVKADVRDGIDAIKQALRIEDN